MTNTFPNWLKKEMLEGVKGFNLDSYLIALEGWRRGLTLTWYYDPTEVTDMKMIGFNPLGKTFSLETSNLDTLHYFYRSRGDKVSNEAVDIVHEKHKTKTYFNEANVPTPKGVIINREMTQENILNKINELNYPLVVKPELGSLGKGVTTDIRNKEDLFKAIKYIKETYEDYTEYIIEEYFEGDEYRIYVIDNQVVAATKRVPANVIGDGKSTIKELIEQKNKQRKTNPYLEKKLIYLDETVQNYLEKNNQSELDVPETNQLVKLKGQANISAGGDPIDATEDIKESDQTIAIEAIKAIPGLVHGGVDIIVSPDQTTVLEVNATADIAMHVFPNNGIPRNVAADLINYYFPESNKQIDDKFNLYFDYKEIRGILNKKHAQEITLTDVPKKKFVTARYIMSGKVQKVGYRNWIRKQAVKKGLNGYTRNLEDGRVVVIVGGEEQTVKNFKKTCRKGPNRANVKKIIELEWTSSIKLGFEIRR